jgi:methyltransferase
VGDSRVLYTLLVVAIMAARTFELRIARRNTAAAFEQGAVEAGARHFPWMVANHTLFLISCIAEVWLLDRPLLPWLAVAALAALAAAATLRVWVIRTLGSRWTVRVICFPGRPVITGGPFRFLRHPNYLAVVVEILALPLVHTGWISAILFSLTNGLVLRERIRVEEAALAEHTDYREAFPGSG